MQHEDQINKESLLMEILPKASGSILTDRFNSSSLASDGSCCHASTHPIS